MEVWFTLKDSGKTQVMSAQPPFGILATLDTGRSPIVTLVDNSNGKFAYVTVGGQNIVKVFRRGDPPELVAAISTGDLPHGIWGSGDGTRVYVGLENQDAVMAIDTLANKVLATVPVGQRPSGVRLCSRRGSDRRRHGQSGPLADAGKAAHLTLVAPEDTTSSAHATVSVNALGPLDLFQMAVSGLKPGQMYRLWLATARTSPFGDKQDLAVFKANLTARKLYRQSDHSVGPYIRARKDCRADATTILACNAGRERRCRACPENTVTMSGVLEVFT